MSTPYPFISSLVAESYPVSLNLSNKTSKTGTWNSREGYNESDWRCGGFNGGFNGYNNARFKLNGGNQLNSTHGFADVGSIPTLANRSMTLNIAWNPLDEIQNTASGTQAAPQWQFPASQANCGIRISTIGAPKYLKKTLHWFGLYGEGTYVVTASFDDSSAPPQSITLNSIAGADTALGFNLSFQGASKTTKLVLEWRRTVATANMGYIWDQATYMDYPVHQKVAKFFKRYMQARGKWAGA